MLDQYQKGGDLTNHIPIVNAYRLIYQEGLVGRVCQELLLYFQYFHSSSANVASQEQK